ncbi:MAG: dynamin family protein [Acidobacteriota bacterium]|nr:dynamin family protein [Acidobacteriota bacterium]
MQSTLDEPVSAETTPVFEQLEHAINALRSLADALEDVRRASVGVPFSAEIELALQPAFSALSESEQRLRNPTFSLAMVGTTSAGKSTLVNALIGRYLAPIDSRQLSAGIVVFRHSDQKLLKIEPTEKSIWESGEWRDFDDVHCHDRLRDGVMGPYWKASKTNHDLPAPNVLVEAPILPGNVPDLLGLPTGVGIEIIDLPGLNSTHDRRNLVC